jgi:hypothetical protein
VTALPDYPWQSEEERVAFERASAARDAVEDAAWKGGRPGLLDAASRYLEVSRVLSEVSPIYGFGADDEIACALLLNRANEVRDALLLRLLHVCRDKLGRTRTRPFRDLSLAHLRTCRWSVSELADLRLLARDWRPLAEPALSAAIGPSGADDADSANVRPRANVLAAFAARDAGRARRALSRMERRYLPDPRRTLLIGALYAEGATLGFLEIPARYAAFDAWRAS